MKTNKRYWLVLGVVAAVAGGVGLVIATKNRQATGDHSRNVLLPIGIQHNSQDVMFSQMMIQHHTSAIDMAALADQRAGSAQVKRLASEIKAAQAVEVETMKQWLSEWGESHNLPPEPGIKAPGMKMDKGMDVEMARMSKEMATMAEEMPKLKKASGVDFDRMFLTMMIPHHEAAITMATTQQAGGRYAPAKELANSIILTQRAEIAVLRQLLTNT